MANIKISEMTEATTFDDGDYTMIVQANQNKKISKENIFSNLEDEITTNTNNISTVSTNIGDLSNLETNDKSNIVNAINSILPVILFENNSGTTEQITLTESKDNYKYLEIFYNGNNNSASSVKMDAQNEDKINLFTANYFNGALYIQIETITINQEIVTRGTQMEFMLKSDTAVSSFSSNVYITKIIGYKEFIDEGE